MCNCNCNEIKITNLINTASGIVLVPARQITNANLMNTGVYRLIIACGLKATGSQPVSIQTASGNVPLLCKFANPIFPNQLRTRKVYCIGFGNKNTTPYPLGQFVVFNNLDCCACGSTSSTPVAAASTFEDVTTESNVESKEVTKANNK